MALKSLDIIKSLDKTHPEVAKEWDHSLNVGLTPQDFTAGSGKRCWFKCSKGHSWETRICKRTTIVGATGCPFCAGRSVCKENSLKTNFPKIAKEWHPSKNGKLTPELIVAGSAKKVWFKCAKEHSWQTSPSNRTRGNSGCPYCLNRKVCIDNCLETKYPQIAKEWHPTKNGRLNPRNVIAGSAKKHWFQCSKGHEWTTTLNSRINKSRTGKLPGCPYCMGRKARKQNSLQSKFPDIAKQWHPSKNGNLTPESIVAGSHKACWFICSKKHEWKAELVWRTAQGNGCPYCSNKYRTKENCLQTKFPEIAKRWHSTKNGKIKPNDVVAKSNKRYWFKCIVGHEFKVPLNQMKSGEQCPFCSNKKASPENSVKSLFPKVAKEWHPTKNGKITPNDVVFGSSKIFWFKCKKGHEWRTSVRKRTNYNTCCPHCIEFKTESKVREIFQKILKISFVKIRPKFLKGLELDGANEKYKIAFEYDGEFHDKAHYRSLRPSEDLKKTKERDRRKNILCKKNGWTLIRVHYRQKNRLEETIRLELIKRKLLP